MLEENKQSDIDYYRDVNAYLDVQSLSSRQIEYIDIKPQPLDVQIPLYEYFERIKRFKADRWQKDFCNRLQEAAAQRAWKRFWEIYHAEGQLGKTSILSQAFPAWHIGHNPLFRFALATYNVTRSQSHSEVVINILKSPIHQDIFPNPDGHLCRDKSSKTGWMTNARRELNDGQFTFNPVGLQSGLTGSGFDWLVIDDPYADAKEAFSETVRQNMTNFWEYTVSSRVGLHSNVTGMFHRYHVQDFAGYLLDTGDFNYIRYASQCDGDYIHEETGQIFPDPLGRAIGEYISPERRPPSYYEKIKSNKRVWNSMFQGRPTSEEGDFFNVSKITFITPEEAITRRAECVALVRAYDNAATEGGGDHTVGLLGGIRPNGKVTIFNAKIKQVDSAQRLQLQKATAEADGEEVIVRIPQDPGSAGKFEAWATSQHLEEFSVVSKPISGTKEMRALNFSAAVNSGDVEFVFDTDLPPEEKWNDKVKKALRDFPMSEFDDPVDSGSDMYNELYETFRKGVIMKNYRPQRNLVSIKDFVQKFPYNGNRQIFKIPQKWAIYAGIKLQQDASRATSAVIVARASMNSYLPETLFVLGEYKAYDSDFYKVFDWIEKTTSELCENPDVTIWAHPDSQAALQTVNQKLKYRVNIFEEDEHAGITEANWYLLPKEEAHPFNPMEQASHLYFLLPENQFDAVMKPDTSKGEKSLGFYHARQEAKTWGYDDKGKPTKIGAVLDCLRMITFKFRTYAEPLTVHEELETIIAPVRPKPNKEGVIVYTHQDQQAMEFARFLAMEQIKEKHGEDVFEDEYEDNSPAWWED